MSGPRLGALSKNRWSGGTQEKKNSDEKQARREGLNSSKFWILYELMTENQMKHWFFPNNSYYR